MPRDAMGNVIPGSYPNPGASIQSVNQAVAARQPALATPAAAANPVATNYLRWGAPTNPSPLASQRILQQQQAALAQAGVAPQTQTQRVQQQMRLRGLGTALPRQ